MTRESIAPQGGLQAQFEALAQRLLVEMQGVYGESLTSLVVFGSVGRGTPTRDSDIDILIIAKDLPAGRMPRVRQFEEVERRLEPDLQRARTCGLCALLSPVFRTEEEMRLGGLIFLDMVHDAKVLLDRHAFFHSFIQRLEDKLVEMKSVRVRRAGTWYWVLKPDLKPGEVFEIWTT